MKLFLGRGRAAFLAALIAGAAAPALAAEPTPTQIDLAKKVLISVGLKASIDQIVPAMLGQLEHQMLQIHPEMGKTLHETLVALKPEFDSGEDAVFTDTARTMAGQLSEPQLQQTLVFFDSDAGKAYTASQAPVLEMLASSGGLWREKLTKTMLDRTRDEMTKKGFPF